MKLTLSSLRRRPLTVAKSGVKKHARSRRGQTLLEAALVMPFLILIFSVVVEAGLALNAWVRVNTAARDATRFVVDAGHSNDASTLVLNKLTGIDFGSGRSTVGSRNMDIFVIKGAMDNTGHITAAAWAAATEHVYDGNSDGSAAKLSKTTIETRMAANGKNAAGVPFVIVEVDFQYTPLLATLLAPNAKMPMTSYAIIQQY